MDTDYRTRDLLNAVCENDPRCLDVISSIVNTVTPFKATAAFSHAVSIGLTGSRLYDLWLNRCNSNGEATVEEILLQNGPD